MDHGGACLTANTIAEFFAGRLTGGEGDELEEHVARCADCRELVSAAASAFCLERGASVPPEPAEETPRGRRLGPGDVLAGRFRVTRRLGRGGMGDVFEAVDTELDERIALKTVRAELAGHTRVVERLKREVQLARKVTHPNVCRIFDVFRHEEEGASITFLTMELLEGETLGARLRREGRLSLDEARPIVEQIAAALDAAHTAGVVHRDLKSDNVMLVARGPATRAVVTDFGLAHAQVGDHAVQAVLTETGRLVGTPEFMAPEQVEGGEIGPRADVYALGVILYHLTTGRLPFVGATRIETAALRVERPAPSPRAVVPELDVRWERVIARCLERAPTRRFARAGEVVAALRPRRRGRVAVVAGASLAVLALGGALAWSRLERGAAAPRRVAVLELSETTPRADDAWLGVALAELESGELDESGQLRLARMAAVAQWSRERPAAAPGELARGLGVDLIARGRFTRDANQLRVDVELYSATGARVATVAEEGELSSLDELSARLGVKLRRALGVETHGARAAVPALPRDLDAARVYAEGVEQLRRQDYGAARERLARATELAPDFARGHAQLAAVLEILGYHAQAITEAERGRDHAGTLPPDERLAVEARCFEVHGDFTRAADALALRRAHADDVEVGLELANDLGRGGRRDDALAVLAELRKQAGPSERSRADLTEAQIYAARDPARGAALVERAVADAEARGELGCVARALLVAGRAHETLHQLDRAAAEFERARDFYAAHGDANGECLALDGEGNIRDDRDDLDGAERLFRRAIDRCAQTGSLNAPYDGLGGVLRRKGDLAGARRAFEQNLAMTRLSGTPSWQASALNNLAGVLVQLGQSEEARGLLVESAELGRKSGSRSQEAYALTSLAMTLTTLGRLDEAMDDARRGIAEFEAEGDASSQAWAVDNLGDATFAADRLDEARSAFERELAIATSVGDDHWLGQARLGLAEVALDDRRPRDAESFARAVDSSPEPSMRVFASASLSLALIAQHRLDEAERAAAQAEALAVALHPSARLAAARAVAFSRLARHDAHGALSRAHRARAESVSGSPAERLDADLLDAEISLRAGEPAARPRLRAVAATAHRLGLKRLERLAMAAALGRGEAP